MARKIGPLLIMLIKSLKSFLRYATKVQFIGAILHKPDLVVLDEPFSGLDPLNQEIFKEIIQQLGKDGTTVLLSAHQMNVVEELCDSVFMIHKRQTSALWELKRN